ncbi:error-prone DNA polymerase [Longispora sp. NPDC051575]|uniref:error-prone DNA polymerase n=1 Tax=Longispora sp. NPDC051575 TaxID=3154943 RepID=UPI00343FC048
MTDESDTSGERLTDQRWGGRAPHTWGELRDLMAAPLSTGPGTPPPGPARPLRPAPTAPAPPPTGPGDYAELHAHSHFSFLDGASSPEDLVAEALRLGLSALALTDHDGMYGVVRFNEAARAAGLPAVFGAELSLDLPATVAGVPDPGGSHLLLLARGTEGYARLSAAIGTAQLRGGEKGRPVYDLEELAADVRGQVLVLTGCRKGAVRRALEAGGAEAARAELETLVRLFGHDGVEVELTDHGYLDDFDRNDVLAGLARELGLGLVATNAVHYARPSGHRLAQLVAAVRARRSLDEMDGWLPPAPTAHLRSAAEMRARFAAWPDAVTRTAPIAAGLAFDLKLVAPDLPPFPVPAGETENSHLRELALEGLARRYRPDDEAARDQLDYELGIIEELGYPGYFLIVWDIVRFCERKNILVQGRGSAANSVVCYTLGITKADPIGYGLLFERFLSDVRVGPPDIDLDIENGRREEVIQYLFDKHGRTHTAQVANVITYRRRSAIRDAARALGYSPGQADAWTAGQGHRGGPLPEDLPAEVATHAEQLLGAPRHLGIHSGGMVICDRPVIEVVPVEWARMENRTVLQWDKDDCAATGLVKFDLLGLGMLTALHHAVDLVRDHHGGATVDLAALPPDDREIYAMIRAGDSIGLFQVESRAQIQLAPRLKPKVFYDLVVQIALVRPGPIQGGAVHPYIRRANGQEAVTYPHRLMEKALKRTLGVPLFQEQMMQLAVDCANFTASEADQLRQAMGSKRSHARMRELRARLYAGLAENGITGDMADDLYRRLEAFAGYGFPESHSLSFAFIVYASAHLKRYYPAAFTAALIRSQPMGFYSTNSLIGDARRHGVPILGVDVNASAAVTGLEGAGTRAPAAAPPRTWGAGGPAVRLGLDQVRGVGAEVAARIAAGQPYAGMADLARRAGLSEQQLGNLATAGAFAGLGLDRRRALWTAGAAARDTPDRLPGTVLGTHAPTLPGMSEAELAAADLWATGSSPDSHPVQFLREWLRARGAVPVGALGRIPDGQRVLVGGIVTHRQAPETAGGIVFVNLEDETGQANVICTPGLLRRYARIARTAPALLVRGRLQNVEGSLGLAADQLTVLNVPTAPRSRDFR